MKKNVYLKFACLISCGSIFLYSVKKTVSKVNILTAVVVLLIFAMASPVKGQTLMHSYTFEDGTANDVVGTANGKILGGTIANGVYTTTNNGDCIQLPAPDIAINTYSSVSMEAYIVSTENAPLHSMLVYFGDSRGGLGTNGIFVTPKHWNGLLTRGAISTGDYTTPWLSETAVTSFPITTKGLHYVVLTVDSAMLNFYVDGVLAGTDNLVTMDNRISALSNNYGWIARGGYVNDPTWIGTLDEFNIYEGALHPDTIAARAKAFIGSSNEKQSGIALDVLRKSYEKCQSVEDGYYEMDRYMKYMMDKDTSLSSFDCYFRKLADDSIYSSAFHYQLYQDEKYIHDIMYTGDDFVGYSTKDSTGVIMSKTLWANNIISFRHNYTFYSPITNKQSYPLPHDRDFIDTRNVFEYIGEDTVNNFSCYHIRMTNIPVIDSTGMIQRLRMENNYWINMQDYIPVQYSSARKYFMNNDTVYQFEKNVLKKYELNTHDDEGQLDLSSIPSYVKLKDYEPYKIPELLPKDTNAPPWSLVSLNDETINLSDLKGQLVLIDFFYKSCYPCLQALPGLQDLHEKYNNKGLKIIGIDPYDTKEKDEIDTFLAKQGVTYTVLLGGKDVVKEYHVSGYPTIYLIDKEGKVLFTQAGYGEGTEERLEEVIKQNL